MVRISCTVNCGTTNPKFNDFVKKLFSIADKARDAELGFFDNATSFKGDVNKGTFTEFLNTLDEFKFFAKVKKQNI